MDHDGVTKSETTATCGGCSAVLVIDQIPAIDFVGTSGSL
jgi:hypothetical protein